MNESYNSNHGTVVNCMDGMIQLPVIEFVKNVWNVGWVDVITEAAPDKILFENSDNETILRIHRNIQISLEGQKAKHLAIVSHSHCDSHKASDNKKVEMLHCIVGNLKRIYPNADVMGIWIDKEEKICQIE